MAHRTANAGPVEKRSGSGMLSDRYKKTVKRAVVFIETARTAAQGNRGSGFIAIDGQKRWLLITCNYLLPSLPDAEQSNFCFGRIGTSIGNGPIERGTRITGKELFNEHSFFKTDRSDVFNYTAMEVREDVLREKLEDELPLPLSLTKCAEMMQKEGLHVNDMLYVVHFPMVMKFDRCGNAGRIYNLNGPYIAHTATTSPGSGGGPLLREYNNEWIVVGLHCGSVNATINIGIGTLITAIADDIQGKPNAGKALDVWSFVMAVRESDVKEQPPSSLRTDLPSAKDVLKEFRERFIGDVDPGVVAYELQYNGIIPEGVLTRISRSDDRTLNNQCLHQWLFHTCTSQYLIKACEIFIALGEKGNPKMKQLGEDMKKRLETGK